MHIVHQPNSQFSQQVEVKEEEMERDPTTSCCASSSTVGACSQELVDVNSLTQVGDWWLLMISTKMIRCWTWWPWSPSWPGSWLQRRNTSSRADWGHQYHCHDPNCYFFCYHHHCLHHCHGHDSWSSSISLPLVTVTILTLITFAIIITRP